MTQDIYWVDLETTGLDPRSDAVLEVAVVRTDSKLAVVIEQYQKVLHWCVHCPGPRPDAFVLEMHEASGLWKECAASPFFPRDIDARLAQLPGQSIIAGNSIHFDRGFIKEFFPRFESRLHHRMIDVSGMREAFQIVRGLQVPKRAQDAPHRALPDALASLELGRELLQRAPAAGIS